MFIKPQHRDLFLGIRGRRKHAAWRVERMHVVHGAGRIGGRLLVVAHVHRLLRLLLLLQQAVDLEPVRAPTVTRPAFGHAHLQALSQATGLARRPVLLVDDALAVVLALGQRRNVVVRPSEERLQRQTTKHK